MAMDLITGSRPLSKGRPGISRKFFLLLPALLLMGAIACGTDRADENPAQFSDFEFDGETLTWAPPWDAGDTRIISLTTSLEPSPALREKLEMEMRPHESYSGVALPDVTGPQTNSPGMVRIHSAGSDGTTAEFVVALEELLAQLEPEMSAEPGYDGPGFGDFSPMLGLLGQLDLNADFGIDNTGATTGVTNMDEIATNIGEFVDSMLALASFGGEEPLTPEDRAKLSKFLAEFPETEAAQFMSDTALNVASGNMFLMRTGQYTLGEPVVVTGHVPTAFGFVTPGHASYELKDISDESLTVQVEVTPADVDVLALAEKYADELAGILGEDSDELTDSLAELGMDERAIIDAITSMIFESYTVDLTIDPDTGWVTAAEWDVTLQVSEELEALIPDEEMPEFETDVNLSEFGATMHIRATFE